nr:glycerol-3-phosphate dehydrogenase 1-like protein [Peromyscus maniculatus bairdii]
MSRLGTARPEDTPRHRRASCLARVAQVAARTEPASTCLRPRDVGVSHRVQLRLLIKQVSLASLICSPPDSSASFQGIDEGPEGLKLISDIIREKMGIDISVLMGANIASEVAAEKFCETTIGSKVMQNGLLFKELLQTPNFRITVVDDADTVELCGALKNIVAVGAGFCDGLRCGDNTKAAVIRLGLMEMIAFAKIFCKGQVSTATFLESCGVADLITTCYGGRNRKVAEAFARTGKTIEELEKEMLNGQKLQGPQTSAEVYRILKQKGLLDKFPLFTAVYQICYEGRPVTEMLSCLQSHPEHI